MPPRVMHVVSGDLWAGAEAQVFELLTSLHRLAPGSMGCVVLNPGELSRRLERSELPLAVLDERSAGWKALLAGARAFLTSFSPTVLHAHRVKEHALAALLARRSTGALTLVRTVHGLSETHSTLTFVRRVRARLRMRCDRWLMQRRTDVLVAVSAELARRLDALRPSGLVVTMPNAVASAPFAAVPRDPLAVRRRFEVGDAFWIGTAGRLVDVKNHDLLLSAASLLARTHRGFVISILGDGPLRAALAHRIVAEGLSGLVRLHGFVDDVLPAIAAFDVFTLSSRHEGLPMALLEAMALGTPTVCTAVGGVPEVVGDGNGLLVPPANAESLAAAFARMMDDAPLRASLASRARSRVEATYSAEAMAPRWMSLYEGRAGSAVTANRRK